MFVAAILVIAADIRGFSWRSPGDDTYPRGAVEYLRHNDAGVRLYNDYTWGGYLIEKLHPAVPVFIDGRTDLYRRALLDDYVTIGRLEPGWDTLLDSYGIESVLVGRNSRLARELRGSEGWTEAYTGEDEALFLRRR
jgi:hypothetical protein